MTSGKTGGKTSGKTGDTTFGGTGRPSGDWIDALAERCAAHGPTVRVVVIAAEGSVPREAGAAMLVWRDGQSGTIGGGALEFDAIAAARSMISDGEPGFRRDVRRYPLGPALGQCCGGSVRVLFERFEADDATLSEARDSDAVIHSLSDNTPPSLHHAEEQGTARLDAAVSAVISTNTPMLIPGDGGGPGWFVEPSAPTRALVYIYGAGHVGRALVSVLKDTPVEVRWVDTSRDRFPESVPGHATAIVAADPAIIAQSAPRDAAHIVMTYSHAMDLAICHAILARGTFGHLGLIGSATKRARFRSRLSDLGITAPTLDRMVCPIGLPSLKNKAPAVIAIGVAADLLERLDVLNGGRADAAPPRVSVV